MSVSPAEDVLVFNAAGQGGRDLYLFDLSDRRVTRVAETVNYETWPSFSPDGKLLVYAASVPGDRADHLFVRSLADGSVKQVTNEHANDCSPRYSPDGSLIVFARDTTYSWGGLAANWSTGGIICLLQSDGTQLRQLTPDRDFAFDPRFSADGRTVIYSTEKGRFSVSIEGSPTPSPMGGPPGAVPSSDEKTLVFARGKYSPDSQIFRANADGEDEQLLTPNLGGFLRPVFGREGDRVFFLRQEWPKGPTDEPKFSVWEAVLDGSSVRMVASYSLFDSPLSWTPNEFPFR